MYMHDVSRKRHFMTKRCRSPFHFRLTDARVYVTLISDAGEYVRREKRQRKSILRVMHSNSYVTQNIAHRINITRTISNFL